MKRLCIILLVVGMILVASGIIMTFAKSSTNTESSTSINCHGVIVYQESIPQSTVPIIAGIISLIVAGFYNFKK